MQNRFLLGLAAGMSLLAATVQAQTITDVRSQLAAENWKAARATVKALKAKDPKDAKPYYYQGQILLLTSTADSADMVFNQGVTLNPKEALNYIGLAQVQFLRNKPTEANANIEKAVSFSKSKDPFVLQEAAEAYLSAPTPFPDKAIALLNQAVALQKNNAMLYLLLGEANFQKNLGGPAITNYEQALALNPKLTLAHMKIGKTWAQARKFNESKAAYRKAIATDPNFAPAYRELGELFYQAQQIDSASESYKKYVALSNNDLQARGRYAGFLYLKKDYPASIALADEVITADPNNYLALRIKGYSQFETGDYQNAMTTLQTYFTKVPVERQIGQDFVYLGKTQMKLGKNKEAIENLNKALAKDSANVDVKRDVAEALFREKMYKDAVRNYRQVTKAPSGVTLQDFLMLGQALYFDKQYQAADSAFAKITEKQPDLALGHQWRGRAMLGLDPTASKGLALPHFEKVVEKGSADVTKNKKQLIEAYEYLGSYYAAVKKDNAKAKGFYQKLKDIDPSNSKANEALKTL
jgi:tetratricopeptide (TPR) repeat protein